MKLESTIPYGDLSKVFKDITLHLYASLDGYELGIPVGCDPLPFNPDNTVYEFNVSRIYLKKVYMNAVIKSAGHIIGVTKCPTKVCGAGNIMVFAFKDITYYFD